MSLMGDPFATPSRIRGVFRYLLSMEGENKDKETLKRIVSPDELIGDGNREMANSMINECVRMELFLEEEDCIIINPEFLPEARNLEKGDINLPYIILSLISKENNTDNHNLCQAIAWYLDQNVYKAPGNWNETENALKNQVGGKRFGVTSDIRFGQFKLWIVYLGFAWLHYHNRKDVLMPDPTCFLRKKLKDIFVKEETTLPVSEVIAITAELCPVLEDGYIRKEVNQLTGREVQEGYISPVTSFAWQRLQDESFIKLSYRSDAAVTTFPGLKENNGRVSEITWLGGETDGF